MAVTPFPGPVADSRASWGFFFICPICGYAICLSLSVLVNVCERAGRQDNYNS